VNDEQAGANGSEEKSKNTQEGAAVMEALESALLRASACPP